MDAFEAKHKEGLTCHDPTHNHASNGGGAEEGEGADGAGGGDGGDGGLEEIKVFRAQGRRNEAICNLQKLSFEVGRSREPL